MSKKIKLYPYRWVILFTFMFVNLTIQILWITFAPITSLAADFYGVNELRIGMLSMLFMIAFIPLSIPASWVIDTFGFKVAVSIGAVLMAVFGLLRGLAGANYMVVFWCTIGIAAAQPFLLNSWTTVPAKWFPIKERATGVGLVTLASLIGTGIGLVVTPILVKSGKSIATIQLIYGSITAFSSILFIILAKEKPPTPPCREGQETRALMLDGLKNALINKSFWIYLFIAFVGLSIFNGITTWVEAIINPRGFSPIDAGTIGALMLVGGVLGSVIIPVFSDKQGKRKQYLQSGVLLSIPGLLGLAFFNSLILL
ncbi:MFS transporter, partial [candidate division KSB1 bacterium]|nr:MFS transporter [candidate division KSB1 bacterium]